MTARALLQPALDGDDFTAATCHGFSQQPAPINSSDRDPWHGNAADRPVIQAQDDAVRVAAAKLLAVMARPPHYAATAHCAEAQELKRALGVRS